MKYIPFDRDGNRENVVAESLSDESTTGSATEDPPNRLGVFHWGRILLLVIAEAEIVAEWWKWFARRTLSDTCSFTALFLPTLIVPWVILLRNAPGRAADFVVRTAWLVYSSGLVAVMTYGLRLGPLWDNVVSVVSLQLGASAPGYLIASLFRSWGYRIELDVRAE